MRIRVTMVGNRPRYELMDGDQRIRDVSAQEITEMIAQFARALRWEK